MSDDLRVGVAKGRGLGPCLRLFEGAGINLPPPFAAGRSTVFALPERDVLLVLLRGRDLPGLLEEGHLDAAISSSIWFREHPSTNTPRAVLDIGRCRLSLIVPRASAEATVNRICTRFPRTTRELSRTLTPRADVVVMDGCNEVALALGFADAIVDIVETGWSLDHFSLVERELLCDVTHGIWTSRRSRVDLQRLQRLLPGVSWCEDEAGVGNALI